jgi:YegS/Rv2252/BmrU family lipid kinase
MAATLVIVNPRSANGSTGRRWPEIERRLRAALPAFDTVFTEHANHATELAREGAANHEQVVLVGGDGTINEVVNGLLADDRPVREDLVLAIVPRGTGADFVRTMGIPHDLEAAIQRLTTGTPREVDVAKIRYHGFDGSEQVRYFINQASVGMGPVVCMEVNRSSKRLGGRLSFMRGILIASFRYRSQPVLIFVDGGPPEEILLRNLWVANGRFSGGGICAAPRARPDDGLLDVVRAPELGFWQQALSMRRLRSGAFVNDPRVGYATARRVEVQPAGPVALYIEVEGEPIGSIPATFEMLDAHLKVLA